MCHGKSRANSQEQGAKVEMAEVLQREKNETAQDRLLLLAEEDEKRGRRKAHRGLEVKFSDKMDCKYRLTASTGLSAAR
jgi:hypothetical protein